MSFSTFFAGTCLVLFVAGCDSDVTVAQGGNDEGGGPPTGGGPGEGGFPSTPAGPPAPPVGAPPGDGTVPRVFAVDHLFIGTRTLGGVEAPDAWKSFGYDLDGLDTSSDYISHCTPAGGAAPNNVFPDGDNGIDNAFGKVVLPILKTASGSMPFELEVSANEPIENGDYALVFDLSSLGAEANYSPLPSSYFQAQDRSDLVWLKTPESFSQGAPLLSFPDAYSTNDVWVSGRVEGTLSVKLFIGEAVIVLPIHWPVVAAQMSPDHETMTGGIISGVLDTQELIDGMRNALGAIDVQFCSGAAVEGILNQVRQASDIMKDATQNPGEECNGISIGLGFTAASATVGGFAIVEEPGEPPCQQ
jgi:hypothetical protein